MEKDATLVYLQKKGVKLNGTNYNRVGVHVTVRAPGFSGASAPRRRPGVAANECGRKGEAEQCVHGETGKGTSA
jgi:hypothetical protein